MRRCGARCARRRAGGPTVLAVFDLDHFKAVNDSWGHPAGDAVLSVIGELCGDALRADDFPARIGGEEFAILFRDATLTDATAIVERLRQTIAAQPILAPGAERLLHVTASFGWRRSTGRSGRAAVLAAADRALYAAKGGAGTGSASPPRLSNRPSCVFAGGFRPRCFQPPALRHRPRAVRAIRPSWIR